MEKENVMKTEMNTEFTFRRLFSLIKKSGVAIVVFCAVAAVLFGSVSAGIFFGTRNSVAAVSALVDFNFQGIENGKDPFGKDFDVTKLKSPSVVNAAIAALAESGVTVDTKYLSDILNNITVVGIVPEDIMEQILVIKEIATKTPSVLSELNNIKYFPSRYKVSIGNLKECNLQKDKARALLDEIIEQYILYFRETYSAQKLLPNEVIEIAATQGTTENTRYNYDFIELYDIYYAQIKSATSYLNAKNSEATTFRSVETGKSFEDLIYSFQIIRDTDLVKYEAFVVQNGISSNSTFINSYLERRMDNLETEYAKVQQDSLKIKEIIDTYKNGDIIYITENGTTTAKGGPTQQYDLMYSQLIATQKEASSLQAEKTMLEKRIEKFSSASLSNTEENRTEAINKSKNIALMLKTAIDEANVTVTEYYETEYFDNAVTKAVTATYESNQSDILLVLAVVCVAGVAIAAFAAVVYTYYSLKKKGIAI